MEIFTLTRNSLTVKLLLLFLLLQSVQVTAQTRTAYWRGGTSTNWTTASNWSDGRIPDAGTAVIIGDVDFRGSFQPTVNQTTSYVGCYSLVIGESKTASLFIDTYTFEIANDVSITSNGTLRNRGGDIRVGGNWTNNGILREEIYLTTNGNGNGSKRTYYYPTIDFSGTGKTISGTNTFNYAVISGSINLLAPITIKLLDPNAYSGLFVKGTLDPATHLVTIDPTSAGVPSTESDAYAGLGGFVVDPNATIKVKATTYAGNYSRQPSTLYVNSTIDYAAGDGVTQTILPRVYGILKISGGGIKELSGTGTTTIANSSTLTQLIVEKGVLDLKTYSLDRTGGTNAGGGTITVANGAVLRIGGSGTFPGGFASNNLGLTSTVEYYGTNQAVANPLYGNLVLSGSGSKVMPSAAMTVAGNFTGSGAASFTAMANIAVSGDVTLSNTANFNGGMGWTHTVGGNWTDNSTFTGNASTVVLNGAAKQINRITGAATFNNLSITGGTITTAANITIGGNLVTSGNGALAQSTGTLTMSGSGRDMSGSNITLSNFVADGQTNSTAVFTVNGDFTTNSGRTFTATAGTVTMAGTGKNIYADGSLTLFGLNIAAPTNTSSSFNINSDFSGLGKLTASNGTITFGGTSTFAGNHDLFNVIVASTKSLTMAANANMGIAGALATPGTMNVTANVPNTLIYNHTSAAQTVLGRVYNNLIFANAGPKTAGGALTVNGNLTINNEANFNAGNNLIHTINGNWINNGTFAKGTGTGNITFAGTSDATIEGATIFNNLVISKAAANNVTLRHNVEAANLDFTTAASLITGTNKITITNDRSGDGWVYGTIERKHSFNAATDYTFAGKYNTINLLIVTGITAITVTNTSGIVSSFTNSGAINRRYDVSIEAIPAGSTYGGTMQLQYNDADLNGNSEGGLQLYRANTSAGPWAVSGFTTRNSTNNFVSKNALGDVSGSWTLSEAAGLYRWNGIVSNLWGTKENWLVVNSDNTTSPASQVPGSLDIAEFNGPFTRDPWLTDARAIKAVQFKGSTPYTLIFDTGSLDVRGNLSTTGAGSATNHQININDRTLTVGGSLILNDGSIGNSINLNLTTGKVAVAGHVEQNGTSAVNLGTNGTLEVGGNYSKPGISTGTFTAGTGTVIYNGTGAQAVAVLPYHHLTSNKTSGVATLSGVALSVTGNLTMMGAGTKMFALATLNVDGNVNVTGGTLEAGGAIVSVKGNWNVSGGGSFIPGTSTVNFIGSNPQTISASTFNHLSITKTAGTTLTTSGNVIVNAGLTLRSGELNLGTFTMNRSAAGGIFTVGNGAKLLLGASNFPANFNTNTLEANSTVVYNGAGIQAVAPVVYSHLILRNGAGNAKKLQGATSVKGDLTTETGATLSGEGQVLTLSGNFINNGIYQAYTDYTLGTLVLANSGGTVKTFSGNPLTINNLLVETGADYLLQNADIKVDNVITTPGLVIRGNLTNNGKIDRGTHKVVIEGNFLNVPGATLKSSGIATFAGTRLQKIQLQESLRASVEPLPVTIEFRGSVAPIFNSSSEPTFGTVIIDNKDPLGIRTSVGWTVKLGFYVLNGAKFDGGPYTHNFSTAIDNSGTIISSGTLNFSPEQLGQGLQVFPLKFGLLPTAFQSTGTLYIGGNLPIALAGVVPASLNNLEIANTHPNVVATLSLSPALPLQGTNWNLSGNLKVNTGATFKTGPGTTYNIGGNIVDNGVLNGTGGSFILTNAAGRANDIASMATIEGSGNTTFGNLTIGTNAGISINKNISILGNLTHNGAELDANGSELNFTGTGASVINASNALNTVSIENLRVSKSAPATSVTLQANIEDVRILHVETGTLDVGTMTITKTITLEDEEESITTLTVADGAFLKVGGTNNIPQLDVYALAPASTVEYYGASQPVESTQYGHLITRNAGIKTFGEGIAKIAGNFTVSDATVVTPAIIEYNGTGNQQVAAIPYKNLALTTGGTKTLAAGTVGVAEALTLTAGASINAATAGVTVDYNGTVAQDVLPTNYYHLKLSNAGLKRFAATTSIAADFIATGATADLTSTETTVDFNGTGTQRMPGLNYSKIVLSGGGNKLLTGNASVAKELRLTNGMINTGDNRFILGAAADLVENKDNYVTGLVETTRFVAANMEQTFGGLGLKITAQAGAGSTLVTRTTGKDVGIVNKSVLRQFAVTPTDNNGQLNATVSMTYFDHELNGRSKDDLVFYRSENGVDNWLLAPGNVTSATSQNEVTITGFQKFSSVTLGGRMAPLPIELIYFTATRSGNNAILKWATAMESDSKGVEVQVSTDGISFRAIGFVDSRGANSSQKQQYSFTDKEANKYGTRYYRLRQLDNDGTEAYYGPKSVDFETQATVATQAYPNPFDEELFVVLSDANTGTATVSLHDAVGKLVFTRKENVTSTGTILLNMQTVKQAGIYFLTVELNGKVNRIKLMRR